jgi:HAD superfamily hydrolase (TIGR01450 family)
MDRTHFKNLVPNYKAIFFDAFGVIKTYREPIEGTIETFEHLLEKDIQFFVLTNDASRSPEQLSESYKKIGLDHLTPDRIISSGMMAYDYLSEKVNKGTIAYLGPKTAGKYLETAGVRAVSIVDMDEKDPEPIEAVIFMDDEGFDWNVDISKTMNILRHTNAPAIVANSDLTYPTAKDHIALAIGGIANLMERILGKHFIHFGKPDSQIFHAAIEKLQNRENIEKSEILMVGDTLKTDIIGGNKFGLDTALVLTGNTTTKNLDFTINRTGITPDFVCDSIALQ